MVSGIIRFPGPAEARLGGSIGVTYSCTELAPSQVQAWFGPVPPLVRRARGLRAGR
jgi:hypothetical protein